MIDPNTPLEEIAEMCNSMEDLCNLLKQCEYKKTIEDDIQISPKLLQEAILKTKHLKTVTISDIQKLLRVGYPKAAKLYELITNSKINEKKIIILAAVSIFYTLIGLSMIGENVSNGNRIVRQIENEQISVLSEVQTRGMNETTVNL